MKTVFLVVYIDGHFVELSRLARLLKTSAIYKPVIWFLNPYPALLRDVATCRSQEWEFILSVSPSLSTKKKTSGILKRMLGWLPGVFSFLIFFVLRYLNQNKTIRMLAKENHSLIEAYHPALLVICEDNVGYGTHILTRIFQERRIPAVIVPHTIANASEAAGYFYDSIEHKISANLLNKWVAKKYPHWVYEYRGRKLLRLPAAMIIAMERAGYSHAHPWVLNSEETTFIAVENEHMLEYYKNENLPEDRLIVTGALYDDVLAESANRSEEMRSKLISEMGLQDDLPLLLCALPPSQFPRDCEFVDYDSLVSFWMKTLSQIKGWNVIVRPHPRLTEEEIDHLKQFGVKISNWDTASLIPLCDLYVASVSATIRWAIACGKPVVNYDVYQMKYTDYENVGGVFTVFSKSKFGDTIHRLVSDSVYYKEISGIQLNEMSKWGRLDGRSSERMLQLFDDVISGKIRRIEK